MPPRSPPDAHPVDAKLNGANRGEKRSLAASGSVRGARLAGRQFAVKPRDQLIRLLAKERLAQLPGGVAQKRHKLESALPECAQIFL